MLSSTAAGVLSWATAGGGLTNFTESVNTAAPNATVPVVRLLATNSGATDVDIALSPKGNGALTAQVADNAATGGNKRGIYAVDWQMVRAAANQVASGVASTVSGGEGNTASGTSSTVSGGFNNTASGTSSTVGGGESNVASGLVSTVSGGYQNTVSGDYSTVSGGWFNTAAGDYSVIPGGNGLTLNATADQSFGFLANPGGANMTISAANTAVFGNANLWLANNNNTPSELRFYEAYNTTGAFPNGTNYVGFKASNSVAADITFTVPAAYPASDGRPLTSTTGGTMSWGVQTIQLLNQSVDCGNLTASGGTAFVDVTVTGAVVGSTVTVSPRGDMENGVIVASARVSAANTVRIKFVNATTGAIDPASINFDITVVQP